MRTASAICLVLVMSLMVVLTLWAQIETGRMTPASAVFSLWGVIVVFLIVLATVQHKLSRR